MTTNPNAPFGFKHVGRRDGASPTFGLRRGLIASANTNKIFTGDPLKAYASGYLDVFTAAAGTAALGGVAMFFEWISKSQNKTVRQNWWPGNGDASGDVAVYYHGDTQDIFEVQCKLGPITEASVGLNADFDKGSGGQQTGAGNLSSFTLDDGVMDTTATRPFKIYRLPVDSNGPMATSLATAGYDPSSAYNRVYVTINNLTA